MNHTCCVPAPPLSLVQSIDCVPETSSNHLAEECLPINRPKTTDLCALEEPRYCCCCCFGSLNCVCRRFHNEYQRMFVPFSCLWLPRRILPLPILPRTRGSNFVKPSHECYWTHTVSVFTFCVFSSPSSDYHHFGNITDNSAFLTPLFVDLFFAVLVICMSSMYSQNIPLNITL